MPLDSSPTQLTPVILDSLPQIALTEPGCPRRARMQIDLILLAIEALALGSSEQMLVVVKELELEKIIPNRVALWRIRSTNPLRLYSQRQPLTQAEAKALVMIACSLTRRVTVRLRQLLLDYQQLQEKQLPVEQHLQLSVYLERFRSYFRSRMNLRRAAVIALESDEQLNDLAMSLLEKLLFCTGTAGMQRLWISLFDGEVV